MQCMVYVRLGLRNGWVSVCLSVLSMAAAFWSISVTSNRSQHWVGSVDAVIPRGSTQLPHKLACNWKNQSYWSIRHAQTTDLCLQMTTPGCVLQDICIRAWMYVTKWQFQYNYSSTDMTSAAAVYVTFSFVDIIPEWVDETISVVIQVSLCSSVDDCSTAVSIIPPSWPTEVSSSTSTAVIWFTASCLSISNPMSASIPSRSLGHEAMDCWCRDTPPVSHLSSAFW